jgi:hypothetical protein
MSTDAGWDDDLLPETTSDERDDGWGEPGRDDAPADDGHSNDQRLEEDRPPHW